jgi:hypothetical protein
VCMICSMGGVATSAQAATLFGAPLVYAGYRRVRRALRLPDSSVAAVEARAQEWVTEPARTSASSASTTSPENCPPMQRRHSASASSVLSGSW